MCDAKLSLPGSVSLKAISCPAPHACLNSEMYASVFQCLINGIAAASLILFIVMQRRFLQLQQDRYIEMTIFTPTEPKI